MHFLQKTMDKYSHYRDILEPIFVAVHQVKYGLRLVATSHQSDPILQVKGSRSVSL